MAGGASVTLSVDGTPSDTAGWEVMDDNGSLKDPLTIQDVDLGGLAPGMQLNPQNKDQGIILPWGLEAYFTNMTGTLPTAGPKAAVVKFSIVYQ